MSAIYRVSVRARPTEGPGLDEMRWGLSALDPRLGSVRCGNLIASDGASVPYRLWNSRRKRAGVLFLHGAFDYSGAYDEIGPRFARRGFTALAIDQRGFGATASRGKWSGAERMVEDVRDALKVLRARVGPAAPIFIVGESMGGTVAIHAAGGGDLDAAGLVLVAPGALASIARHFLLALFARFLRLFRNHAVLVYERESGWELSPGAAIRLICDPLVMRELEPEIFVGIVGLARGAVDAARNVPLPVLTMAGTKEDLLKLTCIRALHDNLPGEKQWVELKDGPHLLLHWRRGRHVIRKAVRWMFEHGALGKRQLPVRPAKPDLPGAIGAAAS